MFDLKTLVPIKKIRVPSGGLDGIMYDDFSDRIILTNHSRPIGTATAIDPRTGEIVGVARYARTRAADVAEMYMEQHQVAESADGTATDVLRQDLLNAYKKAAPELRGTFSAAETVVLSVPPGAGGQEFRDLTRQALALPHTPCRGDVFHALQELTLLRSYVDNRAYQAIATRSKLERKNAAQQRRRGSANRNCAQKLRYARPAEARAIALADDVSLLLRWLHQDVLALNGLPYQDRCTLYDFLVEELRARVVLCPHRLQPVYTLLHNHRDDLLAFAAQVDEDLARLSQEFQVPMAVVRAVLDVQVLDDHEPRRWPQEAALRQQLRGRFHGLNAAIEDVVRQTVRASSVIENLNSRLRNYFFLSRQLGPDYLTLLQFFLNHRRFLRSEHHDLVGKSPAELLTGQPHPHWLDMLGYPRFSRI